MSININAYAVITPKPPEVKSESYIVIDFATKKVLTSKNPDKALSPASVTKLMTAFVVLKEIEKKVININDSVKISKNAVLTAKSTNSARTFLEIGDEVTVDNLLKGLIVQSGNDSAIALSEYVAGREDSFAELMNSYAESIGMKHSSFKNASGLPAKNHYSTSEDLAILMTELISDFPKEYEYYFGLKSFTYNKIEQKSRNKLLFRYDELFGGKTGWHSNAKYCYVASIKRNGRRLIVVTLKAPKATDRFEDAVSLTNYGYRYFENHTLVTAGTPIKGLSQLPVFMSDSVNVNIVPEKTITLTLKKGQFENLNAEINIDDKVIAPSTKGRSVGNVQIKLDNKIIAQSNLVTTEHIKEGSWFDVLVDKVSIMFLRE
jgi:D-alanyl-D-alanine carboxypeptidase (penicillin-binding protein 5/6)